MVTTIQRVHVSSSDLRSVGYDAGSQTLEIEFNSGGIYRYYGVPTGVHAGLMSASSHGKYFNVQIKGRYGDTKVG